MHVGDDRHLPMAAFTRAPHPCTERARRDWRGGPRAWKALRRRWYLHTDGWVLVTNSLERGILFLFPFPPWRPPLPASKLAIDTHPPGSEVCFVTMMVARLFWTSTLCPVVLRNLNDGCRLGMRARSVSTKHQV